MSSPAVINTSILPQLGINSIYIVTNTGAPLIIRNYAEQNIFTKDSVTVSGFLTAINMFAESTLEVFLSDLGISDQRLFFKYNSEIFYIIGVDEQSFRSLSLQDSRQFIEELLWILVNAFNDFYSEAQKKYKLLQLKRKLDDFANEVDSLIVEGATGWLQTLSMMKKDQSTLIAQLAEIKLSNNLLKSAGILDFYIVDGSRVKYELTVGQSFNPSLEKITQRKENIINLNKTITSFGENALITSVNDIGFFSSRIHFRKINNGVIILLSDELTYLQFPIPIMKLLIDEFLNKIDKFMNSSYDQFNEDTFRSDLIRFLYQSIEEIEFILSIAPF